jgi:hypothetical protein
MLGPPWMWWETRAYADADGNDLVIRCEPSAEEIRDYFVTFGPDRDRVVLTDPPAMFLIHITEIQQFDDGLLSRAVLANSFVTARVVWWCQPGPGWRPVPHVLSCRPGEYLQDSETRRRGFCEVNPERERRERDWSDAFYEPMPNLDWPMNPMIIDGQSIAPSVSLSGDRCRQCQRYMTDSERRTQTEVFNWGGDLLGVLQNRSQLCPDCRAMQAAALREREGLPPLPGRYAPGGRLGAPVTLEEYERLRGRPAIADEISGGLAAGLYGPAIKPEQDVVDEIDRLVNEQIRVGPLDDYQVNRYPKCAHCGHQWHGKPCEKCVCLGEFEDPI